MSGSDWAQFLVAGAALAYAVIDGRAARRERKAERIAAANQRRVEQGAADLDRRLRARPALAGVWALDEKKNYLKYTLKNVGLGPAKVISITPIYRDEHVTRLDFQQMLKDFGIKLMEPGSFPSRAP